MLHNGVHADCDAATGEYVATQYNRISSIDAAYDSIADYHGTGAGTLGLCRKRGHNIKFEVSQWHAGCTHKNSKNRQSS
jgi:hypothetical protein